MDTVRIRNAAPADAGRILEIYAYYVEHTAISFEYQVPTLTEFQARMKETMERYPYLVAEADGKILGYAYAHPFVGRAAYDWSCELTIYLDPSARRHGLGRKLYEGLEVRLKEMGIQNLYACIGVPEAEDEFLTNNSADFHRHMGFSEVGKILQMRPEIRPLVSHGLDGENHRGASVRAGTCQAILLLKKAAISKDICSGDPPEWLFLSYILFQSLCQRNQAQENNDTHNADHDSQNHVTPHHGQTHAHAQQQSAHNTQKDGSDDLSRRADGIFLFHFSPYQHHNHKNQHADHTHHHPGAERVSTPESGPYTSPVQTESLR